MVFARPLLASPSRVSLLHLSFSISPLRVPFSVSPYSPPLRLRLSRSSSPPSFSQYIDRIVSTAAANWVGVCDTGKTSLEMRRDKSEEARSHYMFVVMC